MIGKIQLKPYQQFISYGIIGSFCVSLDFLVYALLTQIIDIPYMFANIISTHCGILVSFMLNRHITFNVKNKVFVRFFSFYIIGITGLLLSSGLLFFLIERMETDKLVSKGMTIVIVAIIQFLLNKYISFKNEK
ncbi:MAG: GtrA family protein [Prevotellaceae bacterium]|jgi:putative flippase GtrA|nr:GtrA family protein [Prevotellaceae bacterium]